MRSFSLIFSNSKSFLIRTFLQRTFLVAPISKLGIYFCLTQKVKRISAWRKQVDPEIPIFQGKTKRQSSQKIRFLPICHEFESPVLKSFRNYLVSHLIGSSPRCLSSVLASWLPKLWRKVFWSLQEPWRLPTSSGIRHISPSFRNLQIQALVSDCQPN